MQLPLTWGGRRWVKRFGPGDLPSPATLLLALQVSQPTPNFQASCYVLPANLCKWFLRLFFFFFFFFCDIIYCLSNISAYRQLGVFLTLVMSISWTYSTFFFQSLCSVMGPQFNFGHLIRCWCCKLCAKDGTERKGKENSVSAAQGHDYQALSYKDETTPLWYNNLVHKGIVTINLTKAEVAYNSSGSDFNKWLRNTLLLTFITTI